MLLLLLACSGDSIQADPDLFDTGETAHQSVDLDGDGRRDLWSSMADVIGSVANYLHRHGWEYGQPVTQAATVVEGADMELVARRVLPAAFFGADFDAVPLDVSYREMGEGYVAGAVNADRFTVFQLGTVEDDFVAVP